MIWLIAGYIVIALVVAYLFARYEDEGLAILGLLWPFLLAIALLIGPFMLIGWLGDKHRRSHEKAAPVKVTYLRRVK